LVIPWEDVKTLPSTLKLNSKGLRSIYVCGFSRIPVYENNPHNIIGICVTKNLIPVVPSNNLTLNQYATSKPLVLKSNMNLFDAINLFQEHGTHFALVVAEQYLEKVEFCFQTKEPIPDYIHFLGCITLEDIIEELIQEEIQDEIDKMENQSHIFKPNIDIDIDKDNKSCSDGEDSNEEEKKILRCRICFTHYSKPRKKTTQSGGKKT